MKRRVFAVVLGTIALVGVYFWQRTQVAPTGAPGTQAPIEGPSHEMVTEAQLAEKWLGARAKHSESTGTDRFLGRLAADLAILLAETDSIIRDEKLQVLIDSIAFNEIPPALQFLQQQEQTPMLQDLQVLLIRKGAAADPETAAGWATQLPLGATRSAAIAGVGIVWANKNLPEAVHWVMELAEGEDREIGLSHVLHEAARTQPTFALEWAANLAPNDARDELVRHAARQWAALEPKEAAVWVAKIENPTLREQVLSDIAAAWGETDPRSATELALSLAGGSVREDALVGIAQHWAQKEPERAAAWVSEFPEELQPTALENVVRLWAGKEAEQAEKWADSLPPGIKRDIAMKAVAQP